MSEDIKSNIIEITVNRDTQKGYFAFAWDDRGDEDEVLSVALPRINYEIRNMLKATNAEPSE